MKNFRILEFVKKNFISLIIYLINYKKNYSLRYNRLKNHFLGVKSPLSKQLCKVSLQATESLYEVKSKEILHDYIVNFEDRTCSYREWQSNGYPCGYALAVILGHQEDVQLYAKIFYTLDPYRSYYIHAIIHPNNDNFVQPLQFIGNNVNSANGDEIG